MWAASPADTTQLRQQLLGGAVQAPNGSLSASVSDGLAKTGSAEALVGALIIVTALVGGIGVAVRWSRRGDEQSTQVLDGAEDIDHSTAQLDVDIETGQQPAARQ